MKIIITSILALFILTGCSQKCMNNNYDYSPVEKFMGHAVKGLTDTVELLNNSTQYLKYAK